MYSNVWRSADAKRSNADTRETTTGAITGNRAYYWIATIGPAAKFRLRSTSFTSGSAAAIIRSTVQDLSFILPGEPGIQGATGIQGIQGNTGAAGAAGEGSVTSITCGTGMTGGTITTTGTCAMATTGTAATYSGVTTDAQGRVTAGTTRSFNYTTRALNTCFQISTTRDSQVTYSVQIDSSLTLSGGSQGTVYLRTYTNNICTTGVQEVHRVSSGQSGTLVIGVAVAQPMIQALHGILPAGTFVQLVTENTVGTPVFTSRPGQEVLL